MRLTFLAAGPVGAAAPAPCSGALPNACGEGPAPAPPALSSAVPWPATSLPAVATSIQTGYRAGSNPLQWLVSY